MVAPMKLLIASPVRNLLTKLECMEMEISIWN